MSSDDGFLDVAASIGARIASQAVWHEGRCSWMGAMVDPDAPRRMEYRALGPTLYAGTAGVGLFLARLAAATGDAAARRTAVGALAQAVAGATAPPPARSDGFHAGSLGVAWAAAEVAAVLGAEELHNGARTVLAEAHPRAVPERSPEMATGCAGSIVGLLGLAAAFDDAGLVEDALAAGEALIARATVTRNGWSWAIPGRPYPHHLCGVAHGAGGIGWALLELFAATGDERFRAASTGAFAYERSWLDPASGTWPDLRVYGHRRGAPHPIPSAAVGTWCHGEAGIALSRLRAVAMLGPGPHRRDAEIALEAVRRHLERSLPYAIEDLSLCHGAGGAADALLCAAAALGGRWHEAAELAADLGRVSVERHRAGDGEWPSAAVDGTTPGLFLGLSGIGWLFLRLHERTIPSPLAPYIAG